MRDAMSPEVKAALDQCRWMIREGSKSFSRAARLFDAETRDAAFFLYGWCRYCDDQVDEAGKTDQEELAQRVYTLKACTASAFSFAPQREPVFVALQYVAHRYGIPVHYALELIEGMAMDVCGTRYSTLKELLLYCYRVAGTVGLMMSHVMGLRDERALKHAADLGIAMQLTNIARDITEDAGRGRIYLPLHWLNEASITPEEIALPEHREKLAMLTLRLLREADRYYRSGDAGLWYLSFRSACAVAAARHVYAEIGATLLRKGARAWDRRTYVTGPLKLWVMARAVMSVLRSVPGRLWRPWSPAPLRMVWKYSNVE
ncbi:MAG TPA: phytoene/squalene synthase family protein [Candidatus Binatia bacterium]|nr:phytoene/squalene synthase family protein [Candidatus Binatia bacterium]